MSHSHVSQVPESLEQQAVEWFTLMRSDQLSVARSQAFDVWLKADESHRHAYDAVKRNWEKTSRFHDAPFIKEQVAEFMEERPEGRPVRSFAKVFMPLAAALLLVAAGTLLKPGWWQHLLGGDSYQTSVGQQTMVQLDDGSVMRLNTDSEVEVLYTDAERLIRLKRGQAWFSVAKEPGRSFEVDYGAGVVTALGTEFDVYLTSKDEAAVTLLDGSVRLEDDAGRSEPLILTVSSDDQQGQQVRHDANGFSNISAATVSDVTAWQDGKLIFRSWPLEKALAEMNRYSRIKVLLGDAELGKLKLSGMFHTSRHDVVIKAIEGYFPIVSKTDEQGNIVLLPKLEG